MPAQSLSTVTRVVHSYALGELLGVPGCGPIVDRGLEVLWTEHRDTKAGGYFEAVDATGPVDSTKAAYNDAFVPARRVERTCRGPRCQALYDDVRAVIDEHFWSEDDGASTGVVHRQLGRASVLPRSEQQHAPVRGVPRRCRLDQGTRRSRGACLAHRRAAHRRTRSLAAGCSGTLRPGVAAQLGYNYDRWTTRSGPTV